MIRRPLAVILVLCFAAFGCSKSPEATKPEVQARYDAMDQAVGKEDVKAYMDLLDEKCVLTRKDGKTMTREQIEVSMGDAFKAMSQTVSNTQVGEIRGSGDTIVAIASAHQEATYTDPRGQASRITLDSRTRDTWVKKNGQWKMSASTEEVSEMAFETPEPSPKPPQK